MCKRARGQAQVLLSGRNAEGAYLIVQATDLVAFSCLDTFSLARIKRIKERIKILYSRSVAKLRKPDRRALQRGVVIASYTRTVARVNALAQKAVCAARQTSAAKARFHVAMMQPRKYV